MGITKLKEVLALEGIGDYLNGGDDDTLERIPESSTLLIDGNAFMHYCIKDIKLECFDYQEYENNIINHLNTLLNEYKLNIKIYMDGNSRMKDLTKSKRLKQKEDNWNLFQREVKNKVKSFNQNIIPHPELIFIQFSYTLKQKFQSIEVIELDEESDSILAKICDNENRKYIKESNFRRCYVYSQDSDYIAMKNCQYIEFGNIIILNNMIYAKKVWQRYVISDYLGMTEKQFVEWCLLIGNDFTKHFNRNLYLNIDIPDDYNSNDISLLRQLKTIILSKDIDFQLHSSDKDLNKALEFSRLFYNYEDLSKFPFTKPVSKSNCNMPKFSNDEKIFLKRIFNSRLEENMFNNTSWIEKRISIADNIIQSLLLLLQNSTLLTFDWDLQTDHIQAFKEMITTIDYFQKNQNEKDKINDSDNNIKCWDDFMAYQILQMSFKLIIVEYDDSSELSMDLFRPSLYFNGSLFFLILKHVRSDNDVIDSDTQEKIQQQEQKRSEVLPIDEYRDEILEKLQRDRVVIIHGETGCGKSSRLPLFLYEDAQSKGEKCRMMVSQPTRIAARSLMKRLRPNLGNIVGLRLGNTVKDETDETLIHFCTTGYLVRYLAHKKKHFFDHTHLIIDEIHTRSVDGDILCLLVKRLLTEHRTLKVILMSATIHTKMIAEYFTRSDEYYGDLTCLSVGKRRFPIKVYYLDDLLDRSECSNFKIANSCEKLIDIMSSMSGLQSDTIPDRISTIMYNVVEEIINKVGKPGEGAFLVFVPGIFAIEEIMSRFENEEQYKTIAIHSDIPEDEQAIAFEPCKPNEIKIIIATNAAESSLTLPDVDFLIDLGQCKSMRYDSKAHKNVLLNTWISKASATQRAGRTGRVRPGTVFRLYSEELYNKFSDHDEAEIKRITCEDTILNLRYMLENTEDFNGVIPILDDMMECPSKDNIGRSFEYLHYTHLITKPADDGNLTKLGYFAAQVNVSINLARMLAIGCRLGVGFESVVISAGISMPKMLFNIAAPIVQTYDVLYDVTMKTCIAQHKLDQGYYSMPIMFFTIFSTYMGLPVEERRKWIAENSLSFTRVRQFISSAKNLIDKVKELLNDDDIFNYNKPIKPLTSTTVNLLRFIMTYTCDQNFLRLKVKSSKESLQCIDIRSFDSAAPPTETLLSSLLPVEFQLKNEVKKLFYGPVSDKVDDPDVQLPQSILLLTELLNITEKVDSLLLWSWSESSGLYLYLIHDNSKDYCYQFSQIFKVIFGLFRNRLQFISDLKNDESSIIYFFTVPQVSIVDIEILLNYESKIPSFISLIINRKKNGQLRVVNYQHEFNIDKAQHIFGNTDIREDVLSFKQQLNFPLPVTNGLLTDVSIGFKLIANYKLMNKSSDIDAIRICITEDEKLEDINSSYSITAYKKEEKDIVTINLGKMISVSWSYLDSGTVMNAKFDRQSVLATTIPCSSDGKNVSDQTHYAISMSVMFIGKNSDIAICENGSLLPVGTKWLSLAASCSGINLKDIPGHINAIQINNCMNSLQTDLSSLQLSLCKEVYSMLSDVHADLSYDKPLVDNINSLFGEFL